LLHPILRIVYDWLSDMGTFLNTDFLFCGELGEMKGRLTAILWLICCIQTLGAMNRISRLKAQHSCDIITSNNNDDYGRTDRASSAPDINFIGKNKRHVRFGQPDREVQAKNIIAKLAKGEREYKDYCMILSEIEQAGYLNSYKLLRIVPDMDRSIIVLNGINNDIKALEANVEFVDRDSLLKARVLRSNIVKLIEIYDGKRGKLREKIIKRKKNLSPENLEILYQVIRIAKDTKDIKPYVSRRVDKALDNIKSVASRETQLVEKTFISTINVLKRIPGVKEQYESYKKTSSKPLSIEKYILYKQPDLSFKGTMGGGSIKIASSEPAPFDYLYNIALHKSYSCKKSHHVSDIIKKNVLQAALIDHKKNLEQYYYKINDLWQYKANGKLWPCTDEYSKTWRKVCRHLKYFSQIAPFKIDDDEFPDCSLFELWSEQELGSQLRWIPHVMQYKRFEAYTNILKDSGDELRSLYSQIKHQGSSSLEHDLEDLEYIWKTINEGRAALGQISEHRTLYQLWRSDKMKERQSILNVNEYYILN
jgi:hypothetical protein